MSTEIEFINGLIFKARTETTPDYVLARFSIKRLELIEWLQARDDEWVNGEAKVSKSGKPYAAVDPWKPNQGTKPGGGPKYAEKAAPQRAATADPDDDLDLPF